MNKILFWFRRDLRTKDNHGLYRALTEGKVIPCFILDSDILDELPEDDQRVGFILEALEELKAQFKLYNSELLVYLGKPVELISQLALEYGVQAVYTNEDYEPYAIARDEEIRELLGKQGISFCTFQDHLIFAKEQVLNKSLRPYTVYTPYRNAWLYSLELNPNKVEEFPSQNLLHNLFPLPSLSLPRTRFNLGALTRGGEKAASKRLEDFLKGIDSYDQFRDFPAIKQTSGLGVDLRFGTVSIRNLVRCAIEVHTPGRKTWLNELIWREFFSQILYNFPYVTNSAFNLKYNALKYSNDEQWYTNWCNGNTGYPIIDAGMRQLNQSGFMHNRVRMITASFLCKDLLIDWRWGERYFATKLLDYELASNNGNWQWCASTGCDAQPYFRVFNPQLQARKFDANAEYIKAFVPELRAIPAGVIHDLDKLQQTDAVKTLKYPQPIVVHSVQAKLAQQMFKDII